MEQSEWFYAHAVPVAVTVLINAIIIGPVFIALVGPLVLLVSISMVLPVLMPWLLAPIQRKQGEWVCAGLSSPESLGLDSVVGAREFYVLGQREEHTRWILETSALVQRGKLVQATRKSIEPTGSALDAAAVSIIISAVLTDRAIEGTYPAQFLPIAIVLIGVATLPALSLAGMFGIMGEIFSCAHRVNEIPDTLDPLPSTVLSPSLVEDGKGAAMGESVTYHYEGGAALKEATLNVSEDWTVALTGPSGVEKSTSTRLLIRFMDPDPGSVRFSGHGLRGIDPDEHRLEAALVPQNGHAFSGTFRLNLLLVDWNADDTTMRGAPDATGLEDLVKSLGGLDVPVGDRGAVLFGGER